MHPEQRPAKGLTAYALNHLYRVSTQVFLEQYTDLEEPYEDRLIFGLSLNSADIEQLEEQLHNLLQTDG